MSGRQPRTERFDAGASFDPAKWLSLIAAPAFAVMALVSIALSDEQLRAVCSTAHGPSWLVGMTPMYVLMSTFHLAPWLVLIGSGRKRASVP